MRESVIRRIQILAYNRPGYREIPYWRWFDVRDESHPLQKVYREYLDLKWAETDEYFPFDVYYRMILDLEDEQLLDTLEHYVTAISR